VAEALHHAHGAGVLHRDVKPSNVMLDMSGQCWLIDFGLARTLSRQDAAEVQGADAQPGGPGRTRGPVGTPEYMAPEQWDNSVVDPRTDVWGLGALAYELLTLRRPFTAPDRAALAEKIRSEEPVSPQRLVRGLPPDLAAICRKALHKDPGRRYQTAREFADDLNRWLAGEPTRALPGWWTLRPFRLWAWRHKGWSAALVGTLVLVFVLLAWQFTGERERTRAAHREALLQQLQRFRSGLHSGGWSSQAWELVRQVAALGASDDLRNQAAGTLAGLDARLVKYLDGEGASALAFDALGRRLLLGSTPGSGDDPGKPARLWDGESDRPVASDATGAGPVAFAPEGTPLQLAPDPEAPGTLLLWDMVRGRLVHRLASPDTEGPGRPHALVLTSDGGFAAAAFQGKVVAWDARSGSLLARITQATSAIALSPDGALLAAGNEEGRIVLWSLPAEERLATLATGRPAVNSLALGRDPWRIEGGPGWLLAAGDAGGTVTVWDLRRRVPRSYCRGSSYNVLAVAFSPDGKLLVVGKKLISTDARGSNNVRVLDVATGKQLGAVPCHFTPRGAAFLPDGKTFAVGGTENLKAPPPGQPLGTVRFWDAKTFRLRGELPCHRMEMLALTFTPSGRVMLSVGDGPTGLQLRLWDAARREVGGIPNLAGKAMLGGVELSADGKVLALRGLKGDGANKGEVVIWDTGAAVRGIRGPGK
jgi:WD40 repeat protein